METLLTSQVPGTHSLTGKSVLYGVTKSNWGGAQAYVAMMANGARNAGAKVTVMAGGGGGRDGEGLGRGGLGPGRRLNRTAF
jgi:hypothetical protein